MKKYSIIAIALIIALSYPSCKSKQATTISSQKVTLCSALDQIVKAGPKFDAIQGEVRTSDAFGKTYSLTIDTSAFVNAMIDKSTRPEFKGVFYQGPRQTDCFEKYQKVLSELKGCDFLNGIEGEETALADWLQLNGFGMRTTYDLGAKGKLVVIANNNVHGNKQYETKVVIFK